MSGPIVRRYGFPNFDQIFGKKELAHGVDEPDASSEAPASTPTEKPAPAQPEASTSPPEVKKKA